MESSAASFNGQMARKMLQSQGHQRDVFAMLMHTLKRKM